MTFEEADALRGNPHYKEDEIYRVNCQSCVVAYEMRRRGFDVEAFGNNTAGDCVPFLLSLKTQLAWLTKDGKIPDLIVCKSTVKNKTVDKRGYVRRTYTDNGEVWGELMNKTSFSIDYRRDFKDYIVSLLLGFLDMVEYCLSCVFSFIIFKSEKAFTLEQLALYQEIRILAFIHSTRRADNRIPCGV